MNEFKIFKLKKVVNDNPTVKTFTFEGKIDSKPGQFVMIWIPGVDQKPFGVSRQTSSEFDVSVLLRGKFTKAMFKLKPGDKVGMSGPYGTNFTILKNKKVVTVGGGCGMAPLGFLVDELKKAKNEVVIINGARSKDNLLFSKRFKDSQFCTGSEKPTDRLETEIKELKPEFVYSCGPEMMMKAVADVCFKHKIACELSMERYMKCGFGVCGQCVMDPLGIRMCQEGPVISATLSKKLGEFAKYHRDKSGKKVNF
ncbi:MAG: dihydroorotate dehydrogenase electron transfer subunit [Patescibacteria group bacterium]